MHGADCAVGARLATQECTDRPRSMFRSPFDNWSGAGDGELLHDRPPTHDYRSSR
jgi:hypothetical protein